MHIIELDASSWKNADDFRSALKSAIGAPTWHGDIVGAFLDSIFGGGMNALRPPYLIRIVNVAGVPLELRETIQDFSSAIEDTRIRRLARIGEDVAVRLEIAN
ncbi:barstar family protein [Bradyrhizobium sp. 18BD]